MKRRIRELFDSEAFRDFALGVIAGFTITLSGTGQRDQRIP